MKIATNELKIPNICIDFKRRFFYLRTKHYRIAFGKDVRKSYKGIKRVK